MTTMIEWSTERVSYIVPVEKVDAICYVPETDLVRIHVAGQWYPLPDDIGNVALEALRAWHTELAPEITEALRERVTNVYNGPVRSPLPEDDYVPPDFDDDPDQKRVARCAVCGKKGMWWGGRIHHRKNRRSKDHRFTP